MSDADPLAIGGGGLAGAGFVAGVVRLMFGSALADLKEKMNELKVDVEKAIDTQRADTREQLNGLKEMVQRSDQRHDTSVAKLAVLEASVNALHGRMDQFERETPRRRNR